MMGCQFRFYVVTQFKLGKNASVIQNDLETIHGNAQIYHVLR